MTLSVPFFDLKRTNQALLPQLLSAAERVISGGVFIGGAEVEEFERKWAERIGVKEFVAVGNGLDAIRIMLEANDIGVGDEVIVPAFTYYATWLGVIQAGAIPVPVDVDLQNANLDPGAVEAAIGPQTKAILAVHLFGQPAPMPELSALAKKYRLLLFEDVAQAHLQETNDGFTGAISDGGAFSFYPTKNLGALGDAGGISTNDSEAAKIMRSRRSYGQGDSKYDHISLGWNSRMDPLQAAFLQVSLDNLAEWTSRRREIAECYWQAISDSELAESAIGPREIKDSVWHHFVVAPHDREGFRTHMENRGIMTDVHYPYCFESLMPLTEFQRKDLAAPNAKLLSQRVVSLPIGPWMNKSEVLLVMEALSTYKP